MKDILKDYTRTHVNEARRAVHVRRRYMPREIRTKRIRRTWLDIFHLPFGFNVLPDVRSFMKHFSRSPWRL